VRAALLVSACLAAGCANFAAIGPGDSAQAVEKRVGAPTGVWKNPDGSELWEYAQGPYGRQTYMVTLGSDHAVRAVHQVLSEEYFSRVRSGMSRDEVRQLLGRPGEIAVFPLRGDEVWSWRYQQENPMLFHVLFDRGSGTVKGTQRLDEILYIDGDD